MTSPILTQASIFLSGATAMTALLTTSCTGEENQMHPPTAVSSLTATPQGVSYERRCISDASCTEEQRVAAVSDYLSAVYGNNNSFQYDNVLTPVEGAHAKTYGPTVNLSQLPQLFHRAQGSALQSFISPAQPALCNNLSLWHLLKGSDASLGAATAIGGVHHCFSQFATIFNAAKVEQEIAANPQDWIFFVEISQEMEHAKKQGKDVRKDEVALIYQIADRLNIPKENPVVPYNSEPVMKALEAKGISRTEQATAWVVFHLLTDITSTLVQRKDFKQKPPAQLKKMAYDILKSYFAPGAVRHPVITGSLQVYGLNADSFYKACQNFIKPRPGESTGAALDRIQKKTTATMEQGTKLATQLTVQHIQAKLKQHGRKQALYQMGVMNAPVLKQIYKDLKAVPLVANAPTAPKK